MSDAVPALRIRRATDADWPAIWPIFRAVIADGDACAYPPDTTEEEARAYWTAPPMTVYVAEDADEGRVVGTLYLKPNQPGLGAHVANAGFMVAPDAGGRGIGRAMGVFALSEARRLGYTAMQFNLVVATNTRAVRLWESLGFTILATLPGAFHNLRLGRRVDAYLMHRTL